METQYDNFKKKKKKLSSFNKTTHPNSSKQTKIPTTTILPQSTNFNRKTPRIELRD